MSQHTKNTTDKEVLITHIINAPRELVFKAWTNAEHLTNWYAPDGCTIQISKIDPRKGGTFHHCIFTPDGKECWCKGIYHEIQSPEKIVFSMAVSDKEGNLIEPINAGMDPEWPRETIVTVLLTEHNGRTKVTLHQTVSEKIAKRTGAHPSWILMFNRLGELVANS